MREIDFSADPHRQKHFDFFRRMDQPHTSVCAPVEITGWLDRLRRAGDRFTPSIVFEISQAANAVPEFRQRIRGERVVEHDRVHPSFTVTTAASSVFSFCTVAFTTKRSEFLKRAEREMSRMQTDPSFSDEPGRDDYLFLSAMPWVSFTSVQHAMHYHPVDSVPRIVWGKYFREGEKILLPLSVQVHHALVNGAEVGQFFARLQKNLVNR
jgi:chloramphenicol O-acetyltransferase type A